MHVGDSESLLVHEVFAKLVTQQLRGVMFTLITSLV